MQRVKAHTLRKLEEPKLVEELTKHRVSTSPSNLEGVILVDVAICSNHWLLILFVAFRKSLQDLESARFHLNLR